MKKKQKHSKDKLSREKTRISSLPTILPLLNNFLELADKKYVICIETETSNYISRCKLKFHGALLGLGRCTIYGSKYMETYWLTSISYEPVQAPLYCMNKQKQIWEFYGYYQFNNK